MKIISAHWEKRNLGLVTDEVVIESNDDFVTVDHGLAQLDSEYQVIKSPCTRPDFLLHLQNKGYTVMEVLTHCCHEGQFPALSRPQSKILASLSCAPASPNALDLIADQIHSGMFGTDRIAIDPQLGPQLAAQRYANWVSDEIDRGATAYSLVHKQIPVGFFVMKPGSPQEWHAVLGGIFAAYQRHGFGFFMNYLEVVLAMAQGAKRVYTTFSSNNPAIAAIHYALGYRLHLQHYVLIKHVTK